MKHKNSLCLLLCAAALPAFAEVPPTPAIPEAGPLPSYFNCSVSASKPLEIELLFPAGVPAEQLGIRIERRGKNAAAIQIQLDKPSERERIPIQETRILRLRDQEKKTWRKDIIIDQNRSYEVIVCVGRADERHPKKIHPKKNRCAKFGPGLASGSGFTYNSGYDGAPGQSALTARCELRNENAPRILKYQFPAGE